MVVRRICAESLIELAAAALRSDIAPSLSGEQRYTAAMIANALDISRREIMSEAEGPLWQLLDGIYDDGDGTPERLAADIRSGRVSETRRPGLGVELRDVLRAELAVRNPRRLG